MLPLGQSHEHTRLTWALTSNLLSTNASSLHCTSVPMSLCTSAPLHHQQRLSPPAGLRVHQGHLHRPRGGELVENPRLLSQLLRHSALSSVECTALYILGLPWHCTTAGALRSCLCPVLRMLPPVICLCTAQQSEHRKPAGDFTSRFAQHMSLCAALNICLCSAHLLPSGLSTVHLPEP